MAVLAERPLPTSVFGAPEDLTLPPDTVYVSAIQGEERTEHVTALEARSGETQFVDVADQSSLEFVLSVPPESVELRSPSRLAWFWRDLVGRRQCFLDITGLTHSVWAALVATGLQHGVKLEVVYVEPMRYRENEISGPSKDLFDLTASFDGLAPLPGFATLAQPPDAASWFVPLLGFEGRRFSYVREQVAPLSGRTLPVIGVPGFQPEFVEFAYHGNEVPLLDDDAWQFVEYATANCPFGAFALLEDLWDRRGREYMKVAMIGTKPHSLGAVLFALAHPGDVELLYDHPVRKEKRTQGKSRLLIYHVHAFWDLVANP